MSATYPPEPLKPPNHGHAPWLLHRIWRRLNERNEHFMGAIVGQEGSGKSYTAIKLADALDSSFTPDRVIFDVAKLLEDLKNRDHQPGQFYVLDEAGVQLGRRTWQERGQVLTNQALQLIRNHNLGLIFTLPRLGELDSQAQARLQAFYEITEKEPDKYVVGKWKFMDPDRTDETGTIYKKYPRRRVDGRILRITEFKFTPPPTELVEPYEQRKREFQDAFYERVLSELQGDDSGNGSDKDVGDDPKSIAEEIIDDGVTGYVKEHSQNGMPFVDAELIEMDYGLSTRGARKVKKAIEREIDIDKVEINA